MKNEIEKIDKKEIKWSFDPEKLMGRFFKSNIAEEKLKYGIHPFRGCIVLMAVPEFRTFPNPMTEFSTYLSIAIPYFTANSPRLISDSNLTALRNLYDLPILCTDNWLYIQAKIADPTTTGSFWTKMRDTRRHEIEQLMISVFGDIGKSTYTETDRSKLRRPAKAGSHTPAQIMEVAPVMTEHASTHLGITLHFHNPLTPESDSMPESNHIHLEMFIGIKGADPVSMIFSSTAEVTRFLQLIAFTEAQSGQWVYFRCRYVNTKGEASLIWSVILGLQIP